MNKECFSEEKTFSFLEIASVAHWDGEKQAGGSRRPRCLSSLAVGNNHGIFL